MGGHSYELNNTYHIETLTEISDISNFSFLNNSMLDLKLDNLTKTNQFMFNAHEDTTFHYYLIYTVLSINILVLVIVVVTICVKRTYFVNHKIVTNPEKQSNDIELQSVNKNNLDKPISNNKNTVNLDKAVNTEPVYNESTY